MGIRTRVCLYTVYACALLPHVTETHCQEPSASYRGYYDFAPFFPLSFQMILDIVTEKIRIRMYVATGALYLTASFPQIPCAITSCEVHVP